MHRFCWHKWRFIQTVCWTSVTLVVGIAAQWHGWEFWASGSVFDFGKHSVKFAAEKKKNRNATVLITFSRKIYLQSELMFYLSKMCSQTCQTRSPRSDVEHMCTVIVLGNELGFDSCGGRGRRVGSELIQKFFNIEILGSIQKEINDFSLFVVSHGCSITTILSIAYKTNCNV